MSQGYGAQEHVEEHVEKNTSSVKSSGSKEILYWSTQILTT